MTSPTPPRAAHHPALALAGILLIAASLRAPITVMHLGRVLVEGPFDEIERNAEVREVYLGTET